MEMLTVLTRERNELGPRDLHYLRLVLLSSLCGVLLHIAENKSALILNGTVDGVMEIKSTLLQNDYFAV